MSVEVLKDIRQSEQDQEKRKEAAEKKAATIVSDAEKKARELITAKQDELASRKTSQEEQLHSLLTKETTNALDKARSEMNNLKAAAQGKEQAAVDLIVKEFFA